MYNICMLVTLSYINLMGLLLRSSALDSSRYVTSKNKKKLRNVALLTNKNRTAFFAVNDVVVVKSSNKQVLTVVAR